MKHPSATLARDDAGSFEDAVENGFYLLATKASLPSSESFTDWLKKNCQLSQRTAYKKMECAEIKRKNPKATFPSERAALASVKKKPQAVSRPNKQQRLVQAIAARLLTEQTPQIEAFHHAVFTPNGPPRREIEGDVIVWRLLLAEHGLTD